MLLELNEPLNTESENYKMYDTLNKRLAELIDRKENILEINELASNTIQKLFQNFDEIKDKKIETESQIKAEKIFYIVNLLDAIAEKNKNLTSKIVVSLKNLKIHVDFYLAEYFKNMEEDDDADFPFNFSSCILTEVFFDGIFESCIWDNATIDGITFLYGSHYSLENLSKAKITNFKIDTNSVSNIGERIELESVEWHTINPYCQIEYLNALLRIEKLKQEVKELKEQSKKQPESKKPKNKHF